MAIYAILLDLYLADDDASYIVSFSGTLDECKARCVFDGKHRSWPKSDYELVSSEGKCLKDGEGNVYQGRLVGLTRLARSLKSDAEVRRPPRRRHAAAAVIGVAIGGLLGYRRLGRRRPST